MIPGEAIPMIIALACGLGAGAVVIWRAPQISALKTEMESHTLLIRAWEARLKDAETLIDSYREQLRICRELNIEAGVRVRQLEEKLGTSSNAPKA